MRALEPLLEYFEWLEPEDWLLLAAIVLLPWAFGGVEIWAHRSAAFLIALAAATALARRGPQGLGLHRPRRWLLPAFLLGAWAVLQITPLPPVVLRLLSPEAHRIYGDTFPGYPGAAADDVAAALERDALDRVPEYRGGPAIEDGNGFRMRPAGRWSGWRTLSIRPDATRERLFWYVALLMAFLLVRERTAEPDRARIYRTAMLACFVALALFGLVQAATWNGRMFWVRELPQPRAPFGPYVNFIHFAGVMELAVPWLAGYSFVKFRRPEGGTLWRSIAPVAGGATVLCVLAGLAAPSKAAALLMASSLSVLLLLGASRLRWLASRGRRALAAAALAALWLLGALAVSQTGLGDRVRSFIERWGGTALADIDRVTAWLTGLEVLRDYPLTGTGFGTFRDVFGGYVPKGESAMWAQLHNDWLEVWLDGGVVAGVLVLWLAAGFWLRAWRGMRPAGRLDLEAVGLCLGLASLTVHALLDFNHQIPANALLWVAAAGLATAAGEFRAGGAP